MFQQTYPDIHNWFQPLRNDLIKRYDQGKYFWESRACAYWQEFGQTKIIIPAITAHAEYAVDTTGYFSNDKTSICVAPNIQYIGGLLNSYALLWYIQQV